VQRYRDGRGRPRGAVNAANNLIRRRLPPARGKAYKLVKSYGDDHAISANFTTAAVVVYKPKLVEEVANT